MTSAPSEDDRVDIQALVPLVYLSGIVSRYLWLGFVAGCVAAYIVLCIGARTTLFAHGGIAIVWLPRLLAAVAAFLSGAIIASSLHARSVNALRRAAIEGRGATVQPFLGILAHGRPEDRCVAAESVADILRRISDLEAAKLTDREWRMIHRQLSVRKAGIETDLVLAILGALALHGRAQAMGPVRKLATSRRLREGHPVREAAADCLSYLEARQGGYSPERLMRAVRPDEALLQPAHAADPHDPGVLLRPAGD